MEDNSNRLDGESAEMMPAEPEKKDLPAEKNEVPSEDASAHEESKVPSENASAHEESKVPSENASAHEENEVPAEDAPASEAEKPPLKKRVLKEIREWTVSLVAALLVVLVLRSFVFTLIRVDGSSMFPTLHDNERLFVTVADVKFGTVDRGDVVICHYPNRGRTNFVKRVVATPGDTVYRKNGVTHVIYAVQSKIGTEIFDQVLDPDNANPISANYEYTLGEDEYFVVGDNRYNSHDSRDWHDSNPSSDVGAITGDMIVGHVRQVIWPLNQIRPVK